MATKLAKCSLEKLLRQSVMGLIVIESMFVAHGAPSPAAGAERSIDEQRKLLAEQQKELEIQKALLAAIVESYRGDNETAIAQYSWIIQSGGSSRNVASAYAMRGDTFAKLGQTDRALEDMNRGITLDPDGFSNYLSRGNFYLELREYGRAFDDYNTAIRLAPTQASARTGRGLGHLRMHKFDLAIADFEETVRLAPKNTASYYQRGVAYGAKGLHDRAFEDFETAIKLDPKGPGPYKRRGDLNLYTGELPKALGDFDDALQRNPEHVDARFNRAVARFLSGDVASSLADLVRMIELKPPTLGPALWLYMARLRSGQDGKKELQENSKRLEPTKWLRAVVEFYLGNSSRDAVIQAAKDSDSDVERDQRGKVSFYLGYHALLSGNQADAVGLFKTTLETSIAASIEYAAAREELKRLTR